MKLIQRIEKLEARQPAPKFKPMADEWRERLLAHAYARYGHLPDNQCPASWLRIKELLQRARDRRDQGVLTP